MEDVLRRASETASRRGFPASVDDVLWVLFHYNRDVPAVQLLRRLTPDWQRLDWTRGREQPLPQPPEPAPVARYLVPAPAQTIAVEALASRIGTIEESLRAVHAELASERKALSDLIRDAQRDIVAQRGDAASLRSDIAQRLETLERSLQARPDSTRFTVQLSDRIQTLEKSVNNGMGEGARNWAALSQRLQAIETAWADLGAGAPAAEAKKTPALGEEPLADPIKELGAIAEAAGEANMRKRLQNLELAFRATFLARDEQRDRAAKARLRLGTFLCQKIKDDGLPIDRLKEVHRACVAARGAEHERCQDQKQTIDQEEG